MGRNPYWNHVNGFTFSKPSLTAPFAAVSPCCHIFKRALLSLHDKHHSCRQYKHISSWLWLANKQAKPTEICFIIKRDFKTGGPATLCNTRCNIFDLVRAFHTETDALPSQLNLIVTYQWLTFNLIDCNYEYGHPVAEGKAIGRNQ